MAALYREQEEIWGTDDEESLYENEILTVPQPPPRRSRSKTRVVRVSDAKIQAPPPPPRYKPQHYYSYNDAHSQSGLEREPEVIIQNQLNVPRYGRPRALSQGGSPQPNVIIVEQPQRDVSQTRIKNYPGRGKYSDGEGMDAEMINKLARLQYLEDRDRQRQEVEDARRRKEYVDPVTAERLARLKELEQRRAQELEQSTWNAKMREDVRREEERQERIALEYEEKIRKRQRAEEEAVTRAENLRAKAEAEANANRDRLIAAEREKVAAAAAKQKAETARILAEAKDKAAAEKAEREMIMAEERLKVEREKREAADERARIVAEEKVKAEKAKKEREEERRRILAEEEDRKKKEKEEWEETKARVLAEEKKQKEEADAKKKAEDAAFKQKVKEQFMAVGYSPEYIEDILDKKEKDRKFSASSSSRNNMAIALARPTYIRVQVKHLLPETLNEYKLPWEYDPEDSKFILIKEYIDRDFQQVLFQHTKKILKRKDMLIEGYTKETVTTLKPNVFKVKDKDTDETYLVRRKSTGKSPSRPHRNWMFT